MKKVYLGLGSNLGNRKNNLETAVSKISDTFKTKLRVSSVVETPALLKANSPPEWNKAFLNLVVEMEQPQLSPVQLLQVFQKIERELGRAPKEERWAPRLIDIDILHWDSIELQSLDLTLPHPEIFKRSFVLDPLAELAPNLKLDSGPSIIELARRHPQHSPRLMGILNLTPDSFANEKEMNFEHRLSTWDEIPISIVDVGGESTRPGATALLEEIEWERIKDILQSLKSRYGNKWIKPKISVDTRHAKVAELALEMGVDILNDVSGFSDPRMQELAQSSHCDLIVMHSLCIPADPKKILPYNRVASDQICEWIELKLKDLEKAGIKKNRTIFDPGIGFGKDSLQSLELIQNLDKFQKFGCQILIGHSRKSFLDPAKTFNAFERDPETLGLSLALSAKGVDILRFHSPELHHRAFLAWKHIR